MKKTSSRKRRKAGSSKAEQDDDMEKKKPRTTTSTLSKNPSEHADNPLWKEQRRFLESLTSQEQAEFFNMSALSPDRRAELWMQQADIGEECINRYAWATPDPICLGILKEFSPIVEIGCGSNAYWCRLMQQHGIDVVGFDTNPSAGGKIQEEQQQKTKSSLKVQQFRVQQGGPEVLSSSNYPEVKDRTLFLCYPDEDVYQDSKHDANADGEKDDMDHALNADNHNSSMGAACLEHYQGDIVIHVGELFGTTLSADHPWGRSSGPELQMTLANNFHCLLNVSLQGNWLHTRDSLSVWKRNQVCPIVFATEGDDDDEEEEVLYKHIPVEERLPANVAAPCLVHLLAPSEEWSTATSQVLDNSSPPSPSPSISETSSSKKRKKLKKRTEKRGRTKEEKSYETPW